MDSTTNVNTVAQQDLYLNLHLLIIDQPHPFNYENIWI